jgi:hypothetical protein
MEFFWFLLGSFGVMMGACLLVTFYLRRRHGFQPTYTGLAIMAITVVTVLAIFYGLQSFGVDIRSERFRERLQIGLGVLWLVLASTIAYQRRSSGTVLMDFGRQPMFKMQMVFALLMIALAIASAINGDSLTQTFAYSALAVWFFVVARGRLQVRDRGIMNNGLLSWNRISRCVAMADTRVRLYFKKGIQRSVDVSLPADRRDEFIQLVSQRIV